MLRQVRIFLSKQFQDFSRPTVLQKSISPPPAVKQALFAGVSLPLSQLQPHILQNPKAVPPRTIPFHQLPHREETPGKNETGSIADPVLQAQPGEVKMPAPGYNFPGLSNEDNLNVIGTHIAPPDTMGAVGVNPASGKKYYVQWVNLVFAIWDVTSSPTLVYGPAAGNSLWQDADGVCGAFNDGDVIVLFDKAAGRWFMSQLAIDTWKPEYHQCIAVSTSGDPTGSWYLYDYLISKTKLNDYPKFGVWPNGYYMSINRFAGYFRQGLVRCV